jgi:hypothetical protein
MGGGLPDGGPPQAGEAGGESGSEKGGARDASAGSPGEQDGAAAASGGAQAGGMPEASGAGGGGSGDPSDVFDRSLGDFDGEIARERAGIASAGKGSSRGAAQRESSDAGEVKAAGRGAGLPGDAEDIESDGNGSLSGGAGRGTQAGAEQAGGVASSGQGSEGGEGDAGQAGSANEGGGQGEAASGQSDVGKAAEIPADIPADGTGEDQVARQIREAAMAEKDPKVRDALWEQYRRHTGIKK